MKKRLLALALCLVMMTSLLPVMAYGENPEYGLRITGSGFEKNDGGGYVLKGNQSEAFLQGVPFTIESEFSEGLYQDATGDTPVTNGLVDGGTYYFKYKIQSSNVEDFQKLYENLNASNCSLVVPGYTASFDRYFEPFTTVSFISVYIVFQVTKNHNWRFTVSENNDTLTAQCNNQGCPTKEVSVSLKADSVTLPKSPFEAAQLVGWKAFTDAIPSAYYNSFDYKLNGEEVVDQSSPKAGNYQAGVRIYGLPSPVEYSGAAARANMDGNGYSAYLFTQYTAVDPAVTAQTGDNRPIELMLVSVLVFSALAAAAFIADSKRRLQQ